MESIKNSWGWPIPKTVEEAERHPAVQSITRVGGDIDSQGYSWYYLVQLNQDWELEGDPAAREFKSAGLTKLREHFTFVKRVDD